MMLLPKKVGPFTLMRRLATDGITESYVAILDEPAGKQVVVRKVLPWIARDPQRLAEFEARVRDLIAVDHETLAPVHELVVVDDERYVVEEWLDAVDLERVIAWLAEQDRPLPHNIFLNLATQVCNGLEALHGRPGADSGAEHVLHMALRPGTLLLTRAGQVRLGDYGMIRSPTAIPAGGLTTPLTRRMEYLSPEQTHQDQSLGPSSDIFSLGAVLYELLTLRPMFRADSNLQTIHRVRRAEVTTQLLEVKELLPGLDKVLYRALSLNPRHRYQRAFVLREDLRGLMAGFSFSGIEAEIRDFLAPLFNSQRLDVDEVVPQLPAEGPGETTAALLQAVGEPVTQPDAPATPPPRPDAPLPVASLSHDGDAADLDDDDLPDDTAGLLRLAGATLAPLTPNASEADEPSITDMRLPPLDPTPEPPAHEGPETHWVEERRNAPDASPGRAGATIDFPPEEEEPGAAQASAPSPQPPEGAAAPSPHLPDLGDDLDEPPASRAAPLIVGAIGLLAAAGLTLVCFGVGGGLMLFQERDQSMVAAATPPALDARMAPETPEAPAEEEQTPSAQAAAPRPSPAPKPAAAKSASPRPAPRPAAVAARSPRPQPAPRPTASARSSAPAPKAAPAAMAAAPPPELDLQAYEPPGTSDPVDDTPLIADLGDLGALSGTAHAGGLSPQERAALEAVDATDRDRYTRARVLLYLDAKSRGDLAGRRSHLAAVMALPENQYRPELLVEEADLAFRQRDYARALERTRLAERHWGRLPSDLVFSRKVMMYEIEASAQTGLFYGSDGEAMEALYGAIRAWEKYREHVLSHQRNDLLSRADQQLAKLRDMQSRLE